MVLFTVAVFGAGFGVRLWTEHARPVAAPPVTAVPEAAVPDASRGPRRGPGPSREQMVENIKRWNSQIETYNDAVAKLDQELEAAFLAVLTEDQRATWTQRNSGRGRGNRGDGGNRGDSRGSAGRGNGRGTDTPPPMSDFEIQFRQRQALSVVTRMLAIDDWIEFRDRILEFSPEQKSLIRALLVDRRDKFISLTEGLSMMSIQYSQLVNQVERLTPAGGDPTEEAKDGDPGR